MNCADTASLPVVTPPLPGEALGSWLGRIATCYAISSRTLLVQLGIQQPNSSQCNWLTLKKIRSNELSALARVTRKSTATLASMGTSPWCLPDKAEFGMCASCILESRAAGMPLYWRQSWVDATTVGCLKHASWLVPVDTLAFLKSTNWLDVESEILISAKQAASELNMRTTSCLRRSISMAALHAQALFSPGPHENAVSLRYGYVKVVDARQVADDLLDVQLTTESSTASSLLSAYVFLLNLPLSPRSVSVPRRNGRVLCIRRAPTLGARIFALAWSIP